MSDHKKLTEEIIEIRAIIDVIQILIEFCKHGRGQSADDLRQLYELQQECYLDLRNLFATAVGKENSVLKKFDESLFRYQLTCTLHAKGISIKES